MTALNEAVQLIRQGRKEEARRLLESLIKMEPGNIQAWFWYVETCATTEQRIQVLEVCLKMNPGNPQATQALQTLKSQKISAPAPVAPPKPAPPMQEPAHPFTYDDNPQYAPTSYSYEPVNFDEAPVVPSQPAEKQKAAWEQGYDSYADTSMLSKPKPAARSYSFYNAWMTVLFSMDIESYEDVLNDPEAGVGRAFEWVAYASVVSGLLFPLSLLTNPQFSELMEIPEFRQLFGNSGSTTFFILMLTLAMMVLVPIVSVIGLAINAALLNFLAITFGGNGNYGRTAYALAAYIAPVGILSSILTVIPFVGQCLGSLLGIYNLILTVRALRAAHSLSVGKAMGVIFTPTIVVMIFGCILVLVVGMPALGR